MARLYAAGEALGMRLDDRRHPTAFLWQGAWRRVDRVCNRWRVETDWWADEARREYWRLTTADGILCELYRDMQSDRWFMSRLYD